MARNAGHQEGRKRPRWTIVLTHSTALIGLGLPLVGWGMYLAYVIWGFDFASTGRKTRPGEDADVLCWVALGCTVVGLIVFAHTARRILRLLDHGVEVTGRVVYLGAVPMAHCWRMDFTYAFHGCEYRRSATVPEPQKLPVGAETVVVVDPDSPGACMLRSALDVPWRRQRSATAD